MVTILIENVGANATILTGKVILQRQWFTYHFSN